MTRTDYMDGRVTHDEYYNALADLIGRDALARLVLSVFTREQLARGMGEDQHMNGLPLRKWDALDPSVRALVARNGRAIMAMTWPGHTINGICWSLSETVCVTKAVARRIVQLDSVSPLPQNGAAMSSYITQVRALLAKLTDEAARDNYEGQTLRELTLELHALVVEAED